MSKSVRKKTRNTLAFRSLVDPSDVANQEYRRFYRELQKQGKIPEVYRVKALADNPRLLKLLHDSIFMNGWPESCALDKRTQRLLGLAKSIAHLWEPGVVHNIEGALQCGATSEQITETILVSSMVLGLADADSAFRASSRNWNESNLIEETAVVDREVRRVYDDAKKNFGSVPELYRRKCLVENPDWLVKIHSSANMRYTSGPLDQKTKALICLAASAAKQWEEGIHEHLRFALRSGATSKEIADVLSSTYKTAASTGVLLGFSVPCVPEIPGFKVLYDYYVKRRSRSSQRIRGN